MLDNFANGAAVAGVVAAAARIYSIPHWVSELVCYRSFPIPRYPTSVWYASNMVSGTYVLAIGIIALSRLTFERAMRLDISIKSALKCTMLLGSFVLFSIGIMVLANPPNEVLHEALSMEINLGGRCYLLKNPKEGTSAPSSFFF